MFFFTRTKEHPKGRGRTTIETIFRSQSIVLRAVRVPEWQLSNHTNRCVEHTASHRRAQNSQRGRKFHFSHSGLLGGVFMGYTRSIRGIFMGYSYVSGMCRVCIGYVSGKCRRIRGAWGEVYQPLTSTDGHGNTEIYDYNNLNNINQQQLQSTPFAHEAHRGPRRSQQHSER